MKKTPTSLRTPFGKGMMREARHLKAKWIEATIDPDEVYVDTNLDMGITSAYNSVAGTRMPDHTYGSSGEPLPPVLQEFWREATRTGATWTIRRRLGRPRPDRWTLTWKIPGEGMSIEKPSFREILEGLERGFSVHFRTKELRWLKKKLVPLAQPKRNLKKLVESARAAEDARG